MKTLVVDNFLCCCCG